MLRLFRPLRQAVKATTGITGLQVHPNPIPALTETYQGTLSLLKSLPETSVYRQSVEALTQHRLSVVQNANSDVEKIEQTIGEGQIEELIEVAKGEHTLIGSMVEWKAWEPLAEKPAPGQWEQ